MFTATDVRLLHAQLLRFALKKLLVVANPQFPGVAGQPTPKGSLHEPSVSLVQVPPRQRVVPEASTSLSVGALKLQVRVWVADRLVHPTVPEGTLMQFADAGPVAGSHATGVVLV